MRQFNRYPVIKYIALLLCFLLLPLNLLSDSQENTLEGLFYWAKKFYLEGLYRESTIKLEKLLLFINNNNYTEFAQKVHLLLAAGYEKTGRIGKAREYYIMTLKNKKKVAIEEIDFSNLIEYRRIVLGNNNPGLEKGRDKSRVKKISLGKIIPGILAGAAILAVLLFGKRKRRSSPYFLH